MDIAKPVEFQNQDASGLWLLVLDKRKQKLLQKELEKHAGGPAAMEALAHIRDVPPAVSMLASSGFEVEGEAYDVWFHAPWLP